jgi:photosystem II stability/assembly factor-like uncharacterized protein
MSIRLLRPLLFLILTLAVQPFAAAGRWTEIGPSGGTVLSLAVQPDDPEVLYAGTSFGVYKSVDRGAHWTTAGEPFGSVDDLAVDPSSLFTVYAAAGGGLRRSVDGGETWLPVAGVSGARTLAVTSSGVVYVGTESGILASVDGGGSWLPRNEGLSPMASVRTIVIDPAHEATLFAGMQSGGVYKTEDGGAHWRKVGGAVLELQSITDLAVAPADGGILYASSTLALFRSQDGGETWAAVQKPFEAWSLAVHRILPDVVWAGTRQGVLLSRDGGATWRATASPSEFVADLAADPGDPEVVWAATTGILGRGGVYRSTDGGERWSFRGAGVIATNVPALAVDPRSTSILYASVGYALMRSRDRGRNWTLLPLRPGYIRDVEVDPTAPATVYTLGDEGLFRSQNRGDTWDVVWRFHAHSVYSLRIDPLKPSTLYAAVQGLYRSTNRGKRWTKLDLGVPALFADPVELAPSAPWTLYVLAWTQPAPGGPLRTYLLRSRDRGTSWAFADPPEQVQTFAVDPQDSRTVWAFTRAGIFRTTDGGDGWTLVNDAVRYTEPSRTPSLIAAGSPTVLYLSFLGSVLESVDRGVTWTPMNEGLSGLYETDALTPDPRKPGRLYLGLANHGVAVWEP